jgi:hypothetical protein
LSSARSRSIQATGPGQRLHVAVAEVRRDGVEREDRCVERLVVDLPPQHVERGDDRPRAAGVETTGGVGHLSVVM